MSSIKGAAHNFLDRWVHPAAIDESLAAARHRSFVAMLLALGLFGLGVFPLWATVVRQVTVVEAAIFALLAAPLPIAGLLARFGQLERAIALFAKPLALPGPPDSLRPLRKPRASFQTPQKPAMRGKLADILGKTGK